MPRGQYEINLLKSAQICQGIVRYARNGRRKNKSNEIFIHLVDLEYYKRQMIYNKFICLDAKYKKIENYDKNYDHTFMQLEIKSAFWLFF